MELYTSYAPYIVRVNYDLILLPFLIYPRHDSLPNPEPEGHAIPADPRACKSAQKCWLPGLGSRVKWERVCIKEPF